MNRRIMTDSLNMKKKNDVTEPAPFLPLTEECKKKVEEQRAEQLQKSIDQMDVAAARKAIREAYWTNYAALPSVWVARDEDGSLWLYTVKPVKACGMFHCSSVGGMFQIDDLVYPEITFENSPVKVKLLFIDA